MAFKATSGKSLGRRPRMEFRLITKPRSTNCMAIAMCQKLKLRKFSASTPCRAKACADFYSNRKKDGKMDKEERKLEVVKSAEPPLRYQTPETASSAVAAQAEAMIKARYIYAERHPRDLDIVREKMLKECKRQGFAAVARYLKPIGRGVEGPSIRFAETAIRLMGNISVDQMTVYDDKEKRIVRVIVVDCETNTPYSSDITIEKTVERRSVRDGDDVVRTRQNRQGNMVYIISATEDDLLNKQNALISKAIRTNGLRLLPGDIVEECMVEILATQANQDAVDPELQKRKIFDAFSSVGVSVAQLKEYLGHDAEAVTQKELMDLRALFAAIKEGHTTWREVMESKEPLEARGKKDAEPITPKSAVEAVKQQLKGAKAAQKAMDEIWPRPPEVA